MRTLNQLDHLKKSGFGRPRPRHSLKLLYWFANNCLHFNDNNRMFWRINLEEREYGFHLFDNRYEENGAQLLPGVNHPYYELGNLRRSGTNRLPDYVREDHTDHHDESNKDRIIVSVDEEWFDKVYITEHRGQSDYNPDTTYRITRGLLMIIRRLTLEDFLSEMDY